MEKVRSHILQVFTGDGKGKTTAAIGQCIRALGHKQRVCFIQCVKSGSYGEHTMFDSLGPQMEFHQFGKGFTNKGNKIEHAEEARKAFDYISTVLRSNSFDLVVLDEFTYPISYEYLELESVLTVLTMGRENQNVIITGRNAHPKLRALADMVSVIESEKHHYQSGVVAQIGVEF